MKTVLFLFSSLAFLHAIPVTPPRRNPSFPTSQSPRSQRPSRNSFLGPGPSLPTLENTREPSQTSDLPTFVLRPNRRTGEDTGLGTDQPTYGFMRNRGPSESSSLRSDLPIFGLSQNRSPAEDTGEFTTPLRNVESSHGAPSSRASSSASISDSISTGTPGIVFPSPSFGSPEMGGSETQRLGLRRNRGGDLSSAVRQVSGGQPAAQRRRMDSDYSSSPTAMNLNGLFENVAREDGMSSYDSPPSPIRDIEVLVDDPIEETLQQGFQDISIDDIPSHNENSDDDYTVIDENFDHMGNLFNTEYAPLFLFNRLVDWGGWEEVQRNGIPPSRPYQGDDSSEDNSDDYSEGDEPLLRHMGSPEYVILYLFDSLSNPVYTAQINQMEAAQAELLRDRRSSSNSFLGFNGEEHGNADAIPDTHRLVFVFENGREVVRFVDRANISDIYDHDPRSRKRLKIDYRNEPIEIAIEIAGDLPVGWTLEGDGSDGVLFVNVKDAITSEFDPRFMNRRPDNESSLAEKSWYLYQCLALRNQRKRIEVFRKDIVNQEPLQSLKNLSDEFKGMLDIHFIGLFA
jgi:hypothetical protein